MSNETWEMPGMAGTMGMASMAHYLGITEATLVALLDTVPAFASRPCREARFCQKDLVLLKQELEKFRAGMRTMEAAKYLGATLPQMGMWRQVGKGPRFRQLGRIVRYAREDVEEFKRVMQKRDRDMMPPKEAIAIIGCSLSHLFVMRQRGDGPDWTRVEGKILYDRESVRAYAEEWGRKRIASAADGKKP